MAYDEELAERVRRVLAERENVEEKRMFGGLAFLVRGHMACGVLGSRMMVRVGPTAHEAALVHPHASVMDFTGRPMVGMVYVAAQGCATPRGAAAWVTRGLDFVSTLPDKPARPAKGARATERASSRGSSRPRKAR